ncbi:MAG: leucine-rich repeat domain-containing protein [Prevotella sp.]|nr:leucine-rich repeat domain-containing protein [Prevotella sp.]
MKQFRITILLTVLMSMYGAKAFAYDIEAANKDGVTIYYNWINNKTELSVTYQGDNYYWSRYYSGDVVIPESVEYEGKTYSVTSIGGSAFQNNSDLTSVSIPNSVTSIAMSAFEDCSGLTSVTIPNSVTSIGGWVFSGCSSLSSIIVESGNQHYDSRDQCNAIINSSTNELIAGCNNTVIPNGVTSISAEVFRGCSGLISVTIPSSVTSIGKFAFERCSGLTSIIVEDGNTVYDSRNNCNAIIEKSSNTLITGCNNTTIPEDVTSICDRAFMGCSGLTSVTIPNSVPSIGMYTFAYCSGLTSVTIGSSVTSIGNEAFSGCSALTSVTIPNSVTSIDGSFQGCSGLTSIIVEDGNTVYDSRDNCNAIIEKSSNTLIVGCKNTTIPNSVTSIGSNAFRDNSGLTSVTIPNSVTSIGSCAFFRCISLTSVIIPNSVTSIDLWAFDGCTALNEITCKADTPPTCGNDAFGGIDKSACKLYVPKGHKTDYQAADQWKEFTNIEEEASSETTEDAIKITSAGQTTWCSKYDLDFTDVEGIKAYTAGGYDRVSGTIWLMRVNQVPANEGILIIGTPGDYKVPHKSTGTYYVNMMKGTLQPITINETEGEYTNYYLSNGDSGVGFYKVNGSVALKANRAYLPLLKGTTQAGTRFIGLGFEDDGTTNLTPALSKGEGEGAWYTLQGQRVAKPGKGIYIRNGKKVVVK